MNPTTTESNGMLDQDVSLPDPTWLEVDLQKLRNNIRQFQAFLQTHTLIMPIAKAQAYGMGSEIIVKTLLQHNISKVAVACVAEAIHLRNCGINCDILVFGYLTDKEIDTALKHDLTLTIYNLVIAHKLNQAARKLNKKNKLLNICLKKLKGRGRFKH